MQHRTIYATKLDNSLVQPVIDSAARYGQIPRAFRASDLVLQ